MKIKRFCYVGMLVAVASILPGCKGTDEQPTKAAPVKVAVTVTGEKNFSDAKVFSGTVASANTTTVSFAVGGTITDLQVPEGATVTKGQLLGKLRDEDYINANNIAKAQLAEAQDAYERLKKLHDANALPDIKWVEMQEKLKQAQNATDISERAIERTLLHAPMSGVISKKIADNGQNVAPLQPIYEIISLDDLTIDISVPEKEIDGVSIGQKAVLEFEGLDPMTATVSQKAVSADPLTRSYKVKLTFPSQGGKILPGMVGKVAFVREAISKEEASFMLPSQAVSLSDDNKTFVWVVKGGKTERKFVTADQLVANGVIIREGLVHGDTVVIEGMQKIGTGSRVEIISVK